MDENMISELYTQIMTTGVAECFEERITAGYELTEPIIVVCGISDTPTTSIDGPIALRTQRLTCEVQVPDTGAALATAKATKEALITALHGWRGGPIGECAFESGGPVLYEESPNRIILPVDFMLTL